MTYKIADVEAAKKRRDERIARRKAIRAGQKPTIQVARAVPKNLVSEAVARVRFQTCLACEASRKEGFGCAYYKGCKNCFGRWRSKPDSQCPHPAGPKWNAEALTS